MHWFHSVSVDILPAHNWIYEWQISREYCMIPRAILHSPSFFSTQQQSLKMPPLCNTKATVIHVHMQKPQRIHKSSSWTLFCNHLSGQLGWSSFIWSPLFEEWLKKSINSPHVKEFIINRLGVRRVSSLECWQVIYSTKSCHVLCENW